MQIEFTTRGMLACMFRQSRKLVLVFLAVVTAGLVYITVAKPSYEAAGSLLIKFGHDITTKIENSDDTGAPSIISQDDRREVMQSNVEILQSHSLIINVIKEIGAEKMYPGITQRVGENDYPVEAVYKQLEKSDLVIKASQTSNVIDIKLQNQNPKIAAYFVYRLMEMFIARQSEIYNQPQIDFLKEQVKQAGDKLAESQKQLEAFKAEKGISSIEEELAVLLREKADASTISLEPTDNAWDKLSELQTEESKLRSIYRDDSPQVTRVHESVVLARSQLRQRQGEIKARTDSAAAKISKRIAELEALHNQYNDLVHQVETDEKNYKNYQLRSEEARVNETRNRKNITSVVVIDEPIVPKKPVYPRKILIVGLSALFGMLLGIGTALASEAYDQRFSTPQQVSAALKIPVMASFAKRRFA